MYACAYICIDIHTCPFTNCEDVRMCMHMHTYGCIDIHMLRHLVHEYAGICINTHTCAYIWEHMYTSACVRAYVCICTCISALGRGRGHPKNLTPPLGPPPGGPPLLNPGPPPIFAHSLPSGPPLFCSIPDPQGLPPFCSPPPTKKTKTKIPNANWLGLPPGLLGCHKQKLFGWSLARIEIFLSFHERLEHMLCCN